MAEPLFSTSWYRVAGITPRVRGHVQIHRHDYRGQIWYVLQDPSSGRFYRFSPAAYLVIGLMDGRRTVDEIWEAAATRLGDDAPTQDEIIQLLSQLHSADVLQCEVTPDAAEILKRRDRQTQQQRRARVLSPFAWRLPLVDPDVLLRALVPVARPFAGWLGFALWLAIVVPAAVLAAFHWSALTENFVDRVLTPQSLVILWLAFPLIKVLHELGHGIATRVHGGEVHDLGAMILVFTPVPYVDASAAWAFRSKWQRIAVGAAGMMVELLLAALALFVWVAAEPGLVRTIAYNTMLVAGVSTLLFNLNPLLRFDGYYILADLLEIPNLGQRANAYLGYLCERYLFGRREATVAAATPGERTWFVAWGLASIVYRALVIVTILLVVAEWSLLIAVVFGAIGSVAWVVMPAVKGVRFVLTSPRLRTVRGRAATVSASILALVVLVLAGVPLPLRTESEGVVWVPDEAVVRVRTEGFVERVVARPGSLVEAGALLVVLRDPALVAQLASLEGRVRETEARYLEQEPHDRVKASIIKEELHYARESLDRVRQRAADLEVRSRTRGTFVVDVPDDLPGRFVKQGDVLAHVLDLATLNVRVVVRQEQAELVRHQLRRVDVRLAERFGDVLPATVLRVVPGASERLPAPALGSAGGGRVPVDPRDTRATQALERLFELDLALPTRGVINSGGRAYVRFDHGREPLAAQWYRHLRQLFLARLNV
jgi:putative peptide zinc metalloprotease protein